MITVTTSRHEAKYLASRTLLAAGFTHTQVGLAMLALDDHDEIDADTITEPEYTELEPFAATPEDEAEYRAWCAEIDARDQDLQDAYREQQYQDMMERQQYEHAARAWTLQPVSRGITTTSSCNRQVCN